MLIIKKPPLKPLFFASTALATTPQPSNVSMPVPMISLRKMSPKLRSTEMSFRTEEDGKRTLPDLCANG